MLDTVLSLVVLAAALLLFGAYMLWKRTGNMKNAALMVVLAVIATVVAIPLLDPHARIGEWVAAPMINAITRFVLGLVNLTV